MEFVFLCLTALGLSMDAFAVSITDGMCMKQGGIKHAIRVGLFFGSFQGFMPILGYLGGKTFSEHVQHIDHWIALFRDLAQKSGGWRSRRSRWNGLAGV